MEEDPLAGPTIGWGSGGGEASPSGGGSLLPTIAFKEELVPPSSFVRDNLLSRPPSRDSLLSRPPSSSQLAGCVHYNVGDAAA